METKKKTNLKIILVMMGLVFASLFTFSGCIFNLSTPAITRYGAEIRWDEVENASSYEVVFTDEQNNSTTQVVSKNKINVSPYVSVGKWMVKVRAITNDIFRNNSNFSNTVTVIVGSGLTVPEDLTVQKEGNDVVANWKTVINATYYQINLKFGDKEQEPIQTTNAEGSFVLTDYFENGGGIYDICVQAIKSDESTVLSSENSASVQYENNITLNAPTISSFTKSGNDYVLSWESVNQATSYNVSLLGIDTCYQTTNTSLTLTESQLGKLAKQNGVYNKSAFQVAFVQAESTSKYCADSDFSLGKAYVGVYPSKSNYNNIKVDYFYHSLKLDSSETFDLCADNQSELNALINFVLYYRLDAKGFGFYLNFGGDISKSINSAFNDYDEICELDSSAYSYSNENKIIFTEKLNYKNPSTPYLNAYTNEEGENKNNTQQQFETINSFTKTPRTSTSELPINSRAKSMNVYTSEQLFMAVQAGYKPIFVGGNSGGKIIWDKAQEVALSIIDNSMTDYQKVLAIFDWVCYTNVYDKNLLSIYEKGNYTNLMSYTGWYLEGMFLQNGQAVCDGISKAFALLCGIENIDCYKANGYAYGNSKEGHAWNKVKLGENWYGVDCTWNDTTKNTNGKEVLTHRYFLVSDGILGKNSEHVETFPLLHTATTSYDYFANTKVTILGQEYDMIIEDELTKTVLLTHLYENYSNFEVKSKVPISTAKTDWIKITYTPAMEDGYFYYVFYKNI